jgi:hypothetical protein
MIYFIVSILYLIVGSLFTVATRYIWKVHDLSDKPEGHRYANCRTCMLEVSSGEMCFISLVGWPILILLFSILSAFHMCSSFFQKMDGFIGCKATESVERKKAARQAKEDRKKRVEELVQKKKEKEVEETDLSSPRNDILRRADKIIGETGGHYDESDENEDAR